jgi:hypothetical protein
MHRVRMAAIGLGMLAAFGSAPARADLLWDVEGARANARAGRPVSAGDAELLEHWGCLSGTRNAFCERIRHGANSGAHFWHARRVRR